MKIKNKKRLIIIISSIVLVIAVILTIGFTSESFRQKRVINNINDYVQNKSFVGPEAGTDYVMTLAFHKTDEQKVTINFGKENDNGYYLTFKGNYRLYFEEDKLMMEITYNVEQLENLVFKKEIFNVKYTRKGEISSLENIDEKGATSTLNYTVA